jgi:hypothetical protein
MRIKKIVIGLLAVVVFASAMSVAAQNSDKLPPINVKEYKLKNGLTVVMHQGPIDTDCLGERFLPRWVQKRNAREDGIRPPL